MQGVKQTSGLQLSEAVLLALHSCALIAKNHPNRVSGSQLSQWIKSSSNHLSKVLAQLVKARIILGTRGVNGGFILAEKPRDISFLRIYEAIEGPLGPPTCPCERGFCLLHSCLFDGFFTRVQKDFRGFFEGRTLEDLK